MPKSACIKYSSFPRIPKQPHEILLNNNLLSYLIRERRGCERRGDTGKGRRKREEEEMTAERKRGGVCGGEKRTGNRNEGRRAREKGGEEGWIAHSPMREQLTVTQNTCILVA